ncbi:MAG: cache domain-containing protein, partial [Desulfobacterales bacterium]|nr:cache domain-containing protein [Desulfobacterales bacterium]
NTKVLPGRYSKYPLILPVSRRIEQGMSRFFQFFNNLRIRSKLLGGYTSAFLFALLAGGTIIIFRVEATIESHIESELTNTTAAILNMVETAAATSIKNHLRAVAENNLDIVRSIYSDFKGGKITEAEAKALSRKILFSQTIGRTGYIFCASSDGIAIEHPNPGVAGKNFTDRSFVHRMIEMKTGYLEYDWKNPEDDRFRPKAMYMSYFEPWDWIIAVSSYREEFKKLINVDDFKESILGLKFGKGGYAYINDSKGNLIVHPFMTGNYYDAKDKDGNYFVRKICEMKTGKAVYTWKNPGEIQAREKLVIFNYIPEYDWIIASASYLDEIYAPLNTVKSIIVAIVLLISVLVFGLSFWINASVVRPLRALMNRFDQGASGNFNVRMPVRSTDEIGQLAGYFNRFMDKLAISSRELREEIAQRKQNEQALRLSEEMFSKAFRSSPSGMFIVSLASGKIINVNDSFLEITGFSLPDLIGREILGLSFFGKREEGHTLLRDIRQRKPVGNREISFLTAAGEKRQGLISGEGIDLWGEACMLGAMADITESRRLEREILDISQNERKKIAMSLHDDLCPQLIGIEVMTKMLSRRLEEKSENLADEAGKATKIRGLILDAIEKTRTLSRGLSPVNLEDRRFDDSLAILALYIEEVFSISCTLSCDDGSAQPFADNNFATHVYYIAHEAVHNAARHSRCSAVRITLSREPEQVRLTITDNGNGYNPPPGHTGMGVRIMSYRADRIGGTLTIDRAGDTGTRVCLDLSTPMETQDD